MESRAIFIGLVGTALVAMFIVVANQTTETPNTPPPASLATPASPGPPDTLKDMAPTVIVTQNQMSTTLPSTGPPYYYGGIAYPYQYPSVYFDEYYYRRPWHRPHVYGARDGRRTRHRSRSPSPSRIRSRSSSPSLPRISSTNTPVEPVTPPRRRSPYTK